LGFGIAVRGPVLGVNVDDEREILTFSFIDLTSREQLEAELQRVADQERVRHDRLAAVIESTTVRAIYKQRDEFNFSSDNTVADGCPAYVDPSGH